MSIVRHEYSEINELLSSLRRSRLLSSRGIVQRTFKIDSHTITIQEESERSLRSSVSEIDECMSFFLGSKEMKGAFKGKDVLELDSGCGLLGIMTALLGASVIFTAPLDLQPVLKSNLALNLPNQTPDLFEFDWGDDGNKLCTRFHDFVMSGAHILQNREEGDVAKIISNLKEVSGNGTMLILGYRVPEHDSTIETKFREQLCKYFDLRNGKQVFYETPNGDIVIIFAKRKPFASFFENAAAAAPSLVAKQ